MHETNDQESVTPRKQGPIADYEPPTIIALGRVEDLTMGGSFPYLTDIGTSYFF